MWSEIRRPKTLSEVAGHADIKARLLSYLQSPPYAKSILLHGPPGIGKTTMVLAATESCGMEALEINASLSLRSHEDVEKLADSCRHKRSITSLLRGDTKPMCLILDEVDGSDPHAQRKLVEWMISDQRKIPVLLTCNEVPRIFKQTGEVEVLRCFPPKATELAVLFPREDTTHLAKRFKHDVRRMLQYLQYGESDTLPSVPQPTECSPEVMHMLKQKMWAQEDPILRALGKSYETPATSRSKGSTSS